MFKRILVALIGIPLLILLLSFAPGWATLLLTVALCGVGSYELLHAICGENGKKRLIGLAVVMAAGIPCLIYWENVCDVKLPFSMVAPLALLFVFLLFFQAILHYGKESALPFSDLTAAVFAGLAFPLMLSCLLRLRLLDYGQILVWAPLVIAFGSDTIALFAGMTFGRQKMAPLVSPHKTVAGGIGGLIGGIVGLLVLKWAAYTVAGVTFLTYGQVVLLGLLGGGIGEIGDLSFSVIKREFGIKDYGNLLPGHGGVLDRFDSVTFVTPFVWLIFSIL